MRPLTLSPVNALRLSGKCVTRRIWAAAYSDDVFGCVPSLRVLREGGYEGATL